MKLSSIQRRMVRYRIMYIWKVVSGKVPNFGLKWTENSIRGKMVTIKNYNSSTPAMARKMIAQNVLNLLLKVNELFKTWLTVNAIFTENVENKICK